MNSEVKEKMYKFKWSVSDSERAEVMKIIKYTDKGRVSESSLLTHPHLKNYFEPEEGKYATKKNKRIRHSLS